MDRALASSASVMTRSGDLDSQRRGLRSILRTSNCSLASDAYRVMHPSTKSQSPSEFVSASPKSTMRPSAALSGTLRRESTSRSSLGARLAIAAAVPRVSSLSLTKSSEDLSEFAGDEERLETLDDRRC